MNLYPLEQLTDVQFARWQDEFEAHGSRIQTSPNYSIACSRSGDGIVVAMSEHHVLPLRSTPYGYASLGSDVPVLSDWPDMREIMTLLSDVREVTGRSVYLPLIDERWARVVRRHGSTRVWARTPNSLINWSDEGADLWSQVSARGSSQLQRKRKLVQRDGFELDSGRTGESAARDMLEIDDRSWKAYCGQSMRQRKGQADLYTHLVRTGVATVSFLRSGERPVAFRLDARAQKRVTCLKWSYDEDFKRYSPGLYLLTFGLIEQWSHSGVEVIDLFGGPDTLKDLLFTDRVARVDMWIGDDATGDELEADRYSLDDRVGQQLAAQRGLRHAY